jgi:hypothetical protein
MLADIRKYLPMNMTPVARMLVTVVPKRLASNPPTSGVQVLLRLNADIMRLNSVLDVPISLDNRDFKGLMIYEALCGVVRNLEWAAYRICLYWGEL